MALSCLILILALALREPLSSAKVNFAFAEKYSNSKLFSRILSRTDCVSVVSTSISFFFTALLNVKQALNKTRMKTKTPIRLFIQLFVVDFFVEPF